MATKRLQKKHLLTAINVLREVSDLPKLGRKDVLKALSFFSEKNDSYFYISLSGGIEMGYSQKSLGTLFILTESFRTFQEIRERWQQEASKHVGSQFTLQRVAGGRTIFEATE